jgi:succinyl-CoA synthetase beta subunit
LRVPRGQLCTNAASAQLFAASLGSGVALKIVSDALPHKSDVGGVALCHDPNADIAGCYADLCARVKVHAPTVQPEGVLVEELVSEPGVELFVTLRRDAVYGAVTVLGRGGLAIEVDRDYVVHMGLLTEADVLSLLCALRCAPLLGAFRGRASLAREELARDLVRLQQALLASALSELEINPVLLTNQHAWILDALASGAA